jgi:hypothetical protein
VNQDFKDLLKTLDEYGFEANSMVQKKNTRLVIVDEDNAEETRRYWLQKSPEERLTAVEFLREQFYIIQGYDSVPRIKRDLVMVDRLR